MFTRVRFTGDCNSGIIEAYNKNGKKIGFLDFKSEISQKTVDKFFSNAPNLSNTAYVRRYNRLPKTCIFIDHIVVLPKFENKGVATSLYSKLCDILTSQCPTMTAVAGAVGSKAALKARYKVFGKPRKIRWQSLEKIGLDPNYDEEYITYEKALKILPNRMNTKKLRIVGDSTEYVDVLSDIDSCTPDRGLKKDNRRS